jgi:cell division protein ZipA
MSNFQIILTLIGLIIVGLIVFLEISRRRQLQEENNWRDIHSGEEREHRRSREDDYAEDYYQEPAHDTAPLDDEIESIKYGGYEDTYQDAPTANPEPSTSMPEPVAPAVKQHGFDFKDIDDYLDDEEEEPVEDIVDDEALMAKYSETFVITVMSRGGNMFEGSDLLREFLSLKLVSDEDGYYRRPVPGATNMSLFGIANIMRPGYFKPDEMLEFKTKGVLMYMRLPTRVDSIQAFDQFYEAATAIATALGGEICDENRNRLSQFRLEQMRDKVRDLSRKIELERKKRHKLGSGQ